MDEVFTGDFTRQPPPGAAATEAVLEVLRSGRLHRYTLADDGQEPPAAALERAFARLTGARFALAVASGGYALATALRALGVGPGDRVLTGAFTLAPVPGAIAALGARPVLVEVTRDLVIDLDDLARKARPGDVALISHMRGHICDMDRLMALTRARAIPVVEDCAHTLGARWNGVMSGRHGTIAAYSTQSYKHLDSGEGGLLISDDEEVMARAVLLSGSYMLHQRHGAAPGAEVFARLSAQVPNISGRMDNLRAALLLAQLDELPARLEGWRARYRVVAEGLAGTPGLYLPHRPRAEDHVMSSLQFLLEDWPPAAIAQVLEGCAARGVELKWFGAPRPQGYTSRYDHWGYVPAQPLPATDRVLAGLLDLRLPLGFSLDDCAQIARIIRAEVTRAAPATAPGPPG